MSEPDIVLSVDTVGKVYHLARTSLFDFTPNRFEALKSVSLDTRRGELLAIVGESGSGKSTLARIMTHLIAPTTGEIRLAGVPHAQRKGSDLTRLRRSIQLIQQDTRGSLDPRMTIGEQFREIMAIHRIGTLAERPALIAKLLREVGLLPEMADRLPHKLSGGQRQRVVIARALSVGPEVLVCDEPVSSLDVTVQAQIIELLLKLQAERQVTLIFITHDLLLARRIAQRVAVMSRGELVELGTTEQVLEAPRHDYTQSLVRASLPRRAPMRRQPMGAPAP